MLWVEINIEYENLSRWTVVHEITKQSWNHHVLEPYIWSLNSDFLDAFIHTSYILKLLVIANLMHKHVITVHKYYISMSLHCLIY